MKYAYYDNNIDSVQIVNFDPSNIGVDVWFEVADTVAPGDIYITGGELKYYPPRPGSWCVFDYSTDQWTDPRTVAEYDAYVQAARETARAPKKDILKQINEAYGLPVEDIQDLAAGRFPLVITNALSHMTPLEITNAVIDWSAATEISRLDPVVLAVQAHMGTVDWNLDVLFGIDLDPPPPAL